MAAVRWTFCLEEPLVHFVTLFLANEYFTLLSRWIESIVLSQSMLPVTQVALMPLVPFLIISSLYLANIFALLYILPTIACFIVYEGWIHHVNNTMEAIFFSYPILYRAIRAKTRPFPVFTANRTNSKPFQFKTRPDFFGSRIRTANRTRIRPVPWVPCKRKAESYKLVNGSELVRSRVNVV